LLITPLYQRNQFYIGLSKLAEMEIQFSDTRDGKHVLAKGKWSLMFEFVNN
jgi:hypothetical protein